MTSAVVMTVLLPEEPIDRTLPALPGRLRATLVEGAFLAAAFFSDSLKKIRTLPALAEVVAFFTVLVAATPR